MADVTSIPTTQIAAGAQGKGPLSGSTSGVFSPAGMNFFDLIIARLAAATEGDFGAKAENAQSSATKTNTTGTKENPLVALQVALASQTKDTDGNLVVSADEQGTQKLQQQLDVTTNIINHLKNLLPQTANADKEDLFAKILARLQTKSDNLQASLSTLENGGVITKDTPVEDIPMPLLILFGLKPSEISEASDKIQALQEKLGRDITVEDLIAGVGGIVPPAPQDTVVAASSLQSPKALAPSSTKPDDLDLDNDAEPTDDMAAKLNTMDVGGEDKKADGALKIAPTADHGKVETPKSTINFKEHMAALINSNAAANTANNNDASAALSFTNGDGDLAILQQFGLVPSPGLSLGTAAQAANIITTPATAGTMHPATGTVAAQIAKFADVNGTQKMNIKLDPPELGNLSIRLEINKNKEVKAHMTIEKPETYMMLSRDAHALERALHHAGLDATGNNALTFELAQDNAFNNNGQGGNDNNFGQGGNAGVQDAASVDEILQSSVTWQIDPSTGHVRYNIFA